MDIQKPKQAGWMRPNLDSFLLGAAIGQVIESDPEFFFTKALDVGAGSGWVSVALQDKIKYALQEEVLKSENW